MNVVVENFIFSLLEKKGTIAGSCREEQMKFRYLDSGLIDSFALTTFIMDIEDKFGITLTPEDTQSDQFRYVGGLIELISEKIV